LMEQIGIRLINLDTLYGALVIVIIIHKKNLDFFFQ